MLLLSYFLVFIFGLGKVNSARILAVFPVPSISHQVVFRPLTQELAKRGHEVVVVTPDPAFKKGETPHNLTEIDVHDLSYTMWTQQLNEASAGNNDDAYTQIKMMLGILSRIFYAQLDTPEFQHIFREEQNKYDLLIVEACVRQTLFFTHFFKVPVIQVSSFGAVSGNYEVQGAPTHPMLYPIPLRQKLYNLTLWERASEFYNHFKMEHILNYFEEVENSQAKEYFGPDIPTINELGKNVDMLFLSINPIWEGNRPVPPSVIHMGGLHQKPEKELPKELKNYLDSSKNGVIYVSYGTNVKPSMLPPDKIQMLIKVFSKLPYDVLWKWDKDELPGKSNNIKLSKWLPQSDLLRHPKVKLFITQAGLQSTDEAITAGVPLIGMPMLADQWYNAEKYAHHKIGLRVDMESLTEDIFMNAIKTAIEDESYRRNVVKLGALMRDQPQSPLQRAVWWTEYVLRHGGAKHLRSPAANISWSEYLELNLVSVFLLIVSGIIAVCFYIISLITELLRSNIAIVKLKQG